MLTLRLHKEAEKRVNTGFPWALRGDFTESSDQLLAEPGEIWALAGAKGAFLGFATFNAGAPIPARLLTRGREAIDSGWFAEKIGKALEKRVKIIKSPYYRLIHSEADGLPGLVIDRFGEALVVQLGTAGMQRLWPPIQEALERILTPQAVLLRNDIAARAGEGLAQEVRLVKGDIPALVELQENGCTYFADLFHGQKTGWFYDQRDNRRLIAGYAKGKTVLDTYSHSGGFGVLAAKEGASRVLMVDSSARALELAAMAAERNGVASLCETRRGDALAVMAQLQERFDIVLADPPAYVKSRKDIESGMKGYAKIARHAAALVAPGGLLKIASCSHHATRARFRKAVLDGIVQAGRKGEVLHETGAAADHPLHPHLPQSEYLKALVLRIG